MTEFRIDPQDVVLGDKIRCQHYDTRSGLLESSTAIVERISTYNENYSLRNKNGVWFGKSERDEFYFVEHVEHKLERFTAGDWFKVDHKDLKEAFEKYTVDGWWISSSENWDGSLELRMVKEADVRYIYDQWTATNPEAVSYVTGDGEPE